MADDTKSNASAPHRREVFYVGGEYVPDSTGKHTLQGQMYVERLLPIKTQGSTHKPFPIVFIHGATRSGMVSKPTQPPPILPVQASKCSMLAC